MTADLVIHWFRQDLRLADNPALFAASAHDRIMPIYILDDQNAGNHAIGGAARWWLHHSLQSLKHSLNGNLSLYCGDPLQIIKGLAERYPVRALYWNRCYEPWRIGRDSHIKAQLAEQDIAVHSHNGSLLWEPWEIKKGDGGFYKVFTPFYRKGCLASAPPRLPLPKPKDMAKLKNMNYLHDADGSLTIDQLKLLPKIRWDRQFEPYWLKDGRWIGEEGAQKTFDEFIEQGLGHYKDGRNLPAKPYVSRLSPYLHFGETSPNQLWHAIRSIADNPQVDAFCSQLGWRDFSYSQLYYNPKLPTQNLQTKFDRFPWKEVGRHNIVEHKVEGHENQSALRAWQKGQTGIPMIDAGMRELWQTGYMHNRVRMIVGSFLVKNLLLHWHHGERWFWDCLLDADLANNSASWQWIAGCGADAAPYFRIFNPVTQGQRFDPDGHYVRQFIPEIAKVPNKYLFNPWEAPELILKGAGVELGLTYPKPIVSLKASRLDALEAFKLLKKVE